MIPLATHHAVILALSPVIQTHPVATINKMKCKK